MAIRNALQTRSLMLVSVRSAKILDRFRSVSIKIIERDAQDLLSARRVEFVENQKTRGEIMKKKQYLEDIII